MKKVLSIVLALALVFGFAGMTFAMGPDGPAPSNVGFVLTSFVVSDSILSPLQIMNWSGTLAPTKTYAEGQPIWFVASYLQNAWTDDDANRNFVDTIGANILDGAATALSGIDSLTTVFTSKDNCLNYSYSGAYMNFVKIDGLQVSGGTVQSNAAIASKNATSLAEIETAAAQLKVTFWGQAPTIADPTYLQVESAYPKGAVEGATTYAKASGSKSYYLQLMAFTNACNEAQGTAYAKSPIDVATFDSGTPVNFAAGALASYSAAATIAGSGFWLNLYDGGVIKYSVVKLAADVPEETTLINIGVKEDDNMYLVFDADGGFVLGFASSGKVFRGMFGNADTAAAPDLSPVQYTSDAGGKYVYTLAGTAKAGEKAIEKADLDKLMTFLGFSFGNDYPVLDRHFEAFSGYWKVLEAKYNVAAAVINVPDPGVDIVPKTGDASTAFGMIMVAIAGLAAVGFVMMKRVRG